MPTDSPQPTFVLIRPQMGENIGAAARGMWNFGLDRMRITAPRDGWPNPSAVAMAAGAGRLLDEVQVFDSTAEAVADCVRVYATTARPRDMSKPVMNPQAAMAEAAGLVAAGKKVAVLFGPERAGMENADIAQANVIISVPVNPAFSSLNLAQCVNIIAYEWGRAHSDMPEQAPGLAGADWATQQEIEALHAHYARRLDEAGFFYPEHKGPSMRMNLRNMWSRMPLTGADVQILHGIMRQMVRWKERGSK